MSEGCKIRGFLGLRRACKFEARYDKSSPDLSQLAGRVNFRSDDAIEKFRTETYVRDVCVKCGRTIERGGK